MATALVIWDHGAGWNGIAFDEDTADFGGVDHISLPDLIRLRLLR